MSSKIYLSPKVLKNPTKLMEEEYSSIHQEEVLLTTKMAFTEEISKILSKTYSLYRIRKKPIEIVFSML